MNTLTWTEFAERYCDRQELTPEGLLEVLKQQKQRSQPTGWMLLECQQLDSSRMGSYTILPYGPNNTYHAPPDRPISLRGLASDMSMVVALLPASEIP